jgi:hypothetical protein
VGLHLSPGIWSEVIPMQFAAILLWDRDYMKTTSANEGLLLWWWWIFVTHNNTLCKDVGTESAPFLCRSPTWFERNGSRKPISQFAIQLPSVGLLFNRCYRDSHLDGTQSAYRPLLPNEMQIWELASAPTGSLYRNLYFFDSFATEDLAVTFYYFAPLCIVLMQRVHW